MFVSFSPLYFPLETSGQFKRLGVQGEGGGATINPYQAFIPRVEMGKETKYI